MHLTEWAQFSRIDPDRLAARAASPKAIDGWGTLDPDRGRAAGSSVRALGRL